MTSPASWGELLAQARVAWTEGQEHDALQLCDRAALLSSEARYGAALLRGDILLSLGDAAGALSSFDSVADPSVPDAQLDCARGLALFELARFAESENALTSALRQNDSLPDAHFALGVMSEILGTNQESEHFRRARKLAPDRFAMPPRLSMEEFEEVVEQALERLPERVRTAMQAMPVLVAQMPRIEDLQLSDPPLSPQSFGMVVNLAEAGPNHLPDSSAPTQPGVLLFKRNLERACGERSELIETVRSTVLEEAVAALRLPYDDDLEDWPGMH